MLKSVKMTIVEDNGSYSHNMKINDFPEQDDMTLMKNCFVALLIKYGFDDSEIDKLFGKVDK